MAEAEYKIWTPQPGFQERFVRSNVDVVFGGGTMNSGKPCISTSYVLTPKGWVMNKDLVVGQLVCTPFGEPTPIVDIFPQGVIDLYELKTIDGRSVECGLYHLWEVSDGEHVRNYNGRRNDKGHKVLTTEEIIFLMGKGEELYIPTPDAVQFGTKRYKVSPYDFGLSVISERHKYINEEYLWGDISQRMDLLCGITGLMKGFDEKKKHTFVTEYEGLKDDFVYLCRSLGYVARTTSSHGIWKVTFRKESHVLIDSVRYTRKEEAQCLMLSDRDHLYIVDDFLVTHNSFGAILSIAEPCLDGNFRAVFLRRSLAETKIAGGLLDDMKKVYNGIVSVRESDNPRVVFPSGAFVDLTHINDENEQKLIERIKGWQYDMIYFDEGTSYAWTTFKNLFSRNRGKGKWTGKIRLTTNPKRSHWIRTFINDYIGVDGYIKPDWDGRVRYFFINGKEVTDVVWGDSKEEVYYKCKYAIDSILSRTKSKSVQFTYEDLIKSFTFYLGNIGENKASIGSNSSYLGSVAVMGDKLAMANLQGNWNVNLDEEEDSVISNTDARAVFTNDSQINNDWYISADLADTGTDNCVIIVWNGFHIVDMKILSDSTPLTNAMAIIEMAEKYDVCDEHIIYDGVRAAYMIDYIPDAIPFKSYSPTMGKYGRGYARLKDECFSRLAVMIKNGNISFSDEVAMRKYEHKNLNSITIQTEFLEECSVVAYVKGDNGKKKLLSKREMNNKLGKNRSMDVLDPIAMRMYFVLDCEYGKELQRTQVEEIGEALPDVQGYSQSIYDDDVWC